MLFLLVFSNSVRPQVLDSPEDLIADYERLRIEYQDNYRDSLYLDSFFNLREIAIDQKYDELLLGFGSDNWVILNAVGFYEIVIADIERLKLSERVNLSEQELNYLNLQLLEAYSRTRNTVKGILTAKEIISNSSDEKDLTTARGFLSILYSNAGRFKESADILIQNLQYFESVKDTQSQIATLNNLAQLNETLHNYSLALDIYKQAENLTLQSGDQERELLILSSLGVYHKNIEDYDSATKYYLRAIDLSKRLDDMSAYAQNNFNLGNIYYEQDQFEKASERYDESYKIVKGLNFRYPQALIGMMRGTLLLDLNAISAAESFLIEAEEIMTEIDDLESQLFLDTKLAELYEKKGNYEQAFKYSQTVVENQKLILEEGSIDSLNQQLLDFQLRQTELLNENQTIEAKRAQQTNIFSTILTVVLGLGLMIALLLNQQKKVLIGKLFSVAKNEFTESIKVVDNQKLSKGEKGLSIDIFKVELAKTTKTGARRTLFNTLFEVILTKELYKDPELGLNQLSKEVKSNTAYVSEAINTNLEMGYNSFINRIRTKKAQYLFLNTDMSIEDIMDECGYRNRSTFYRAFQNETGLTPGEFIKQRTTSKQNTNHS